MARPPTGFADGGAACAGQRLRAAAACRDCRGIRRSRPPRTECGGDLWSIRCLAPLPAYDTIPVAVARRCAAIGCRPGGVVLDLFAAGAATGIAARREQRRYIGGETNIAYLLIAKRRLLSGEGGAR
jgi:site-specific DNA-methyltransferase (cytosine-N4-specific)